MIGTALSGVTFISVPGEVGNPDLQFKYFQFILGNAIGFLIIAFRVEKEEFKKIPIFQKFFKLG
jgi:hypothetical protein